jgi:ATP-binding cassette subfamily F protein 3
MIHIKDLSYRIGGRALFEDADLYIPDGHHVGLIGRNGAGKTTLFKLICGELHPDAGEITLPKNYRIGLVAQHPPSGDRTPLEEVLAADTEREDLMQELNNNPDPMREAEIHYRLIEIDAHKATSKAALILKGLGFSDEDQVKPLSSFSGGWRMRVALAGTIFAEPDLLLLDEPTNHLDLEACIWLEDYLKSYPKTILFISHEHSFLNNVADAICDLRNKGLKLYTGNYDTYVYTKELQEGLEEAERTKKETQIKHMQEFVDRFGAKASKAKQAQSRAKVIEKLKADMKEESTDKNFTFRFVFPEAPLLPPPILTVHQGVLSYVPEKPVLQNLSFSLLPNIRLGFLGANGNGKSTLAKFIVGILKLAQGDSHRDPKLKVGYFEQYQIENLRDEWSAYDHLNELWPQKTPEQIRARLGQFGFSGDRAFQKVGVLSGGEKTRLNFALITCEAPHLLILDEPTNHLDMESKNALAKAIKSFKGGVIIISHDFDFLEMTVDEFWLIGQKKVTPWNQSLKAYRKYIINLANESEAKPEKQKVKTNPSKAAHHEKKTKELEKKIREHHEKLKKVEDALADPETYKDNAKFQNLLSDQKEIKSVIEKSEAEWFQLQE